MQRKIAPLLPMTVKLAWWFKGAEYALINNFGWREEEAAKFVAVYHPISAAYRATG
jgi:hypothetical protein